MTGRPPRRFRGLERRLKLLVIAGLGRLLRAPPPARIPHWSARPHRVLYLRYDHIGDMVLVTGILHAIRQAQPTVTIDVLASVRNAPVLRGNTDIGTVYCIDKVRPWSFLSALARVRRVRYDAVLDAMVTGASLTSMLIMWASGARERIGVAGRGNDYALTLPVPGVAGAIHYVDVSAALLRPFGIDPSAYAPCSSRHPDVPRARAPTAVRDADSGWGLWRPRIPLSMEEIAEAQACWRIVEERVPAHRACGRPRRLAVNVSAGKSRRCWPEERFAATLRILRERFPGLQMLLLGTRADERRKQRIGHSCGVPGAETSSARQMMALIATCDLVLTPDTAVTHVASAFRKPVVALFTRGGGPHWGPYGVPGRIVSAPGRSLASLEVQPVLQALAEVLAADTALATRPSTAARPRCEGGSRRGRLEPTDRRVAAAEPGFGLPAVEAQASSRQKPPTLVPRGQISLDIPRLQ
jgi:ADP-heptose:LPS heptosyltransferase